MNAPHPPAPTSPSTLLPNARRLRVGDAERTAACDTLAQHFELGRLRPHELDERLAAAIDATTRSDLDTLLNDLPPLAHPAEPVAPVAARSGFGSPLADALLGTTAAFAVCIVTFMLLGSALLSDGMFVFALVGGTLTMFFSVVFTRLLSPRASVSPRGAARAGGAHAR